MSEYSTKVTNVNGTYCCRVFYKGKPVLEGRVQSREDIGPAFRDLMRTIDKGATGGGDTYTHAARTRKGPTRPVKHIWL